MRANQLTRTGGAAIAALLLYLSNLAPSHASGDWFDSFRDELRATQDMSGNMEGVRFVVGNDIWQAGTEFKSGKGWLALACGPASCALQPAALSARPRTSREPDGDQPAGARLRVAHELGVVDALVFQLVGELQRASGGRTPPQT